MNRWNHEKCQIDTIRSLEINSQQTLWKKCENNRREKKNNISTRPAINTAFFGEYLDFVWSAEKCKKKLSTEFGWLVSAHQLGESVQKKRKEEKFSDYLCVAKVNWGADVWVALPLTCKVMYAHGSRSPQTLAHADTSAHTRALPPTSRQRRFVGCVAEPIHFNPFSASVVIVMILWPANFLFSCWNTA